MDNQNENTFMEKRMAPRHNDEYMALLKVSELLQGRGCTMNISQGGMLVHTNNLFRHIRSIRVPERVGSPIKVVFSHNSLIVEGRIVRIDVHKGEVAIKLGRFSDVQAWETMLHRKDKAEN